MCGRALAGAALPADGSIRGTPSQPAISAVSSALRTTLPIFTRLVMVTLLLDGTPSRDALFSLPWAAARREHRLRRRPLIPRPCSVPRVQVRTVSTGLRGQLPIETRQAPLSSRRRRDLTLPCTEIG